MKRQSVVQQGDALYDALRRRYEEEKSPVFEYKDTKYRVVSVSPLRFIEVSSAPLTKYSSVSIQQPHDSTEETANS